MWRQAFSRSPLRSWAGSRAAAGVSSGERVTVHHVKIKPGTGPIRKALSYTLTGIICYKVWELVITLPLRNIDPRDLPEADKNEKLEPLFLPLPFTVEEFQPPPYAGAEEEWQSFINFSKDNQLRERVKNELSMKVKKAAENNPFTKKWTTPSNGFQLGPSWLIISFPEKPPPEFVRWGLEWNDEGLFVKQKKLDARTKALLDRVLLPYPVASATYAFANAMFKQNVSSVSKFFGYSSEENQLNTGSPNSDIQKTLKKLEARQSATGDTSSSPSSTPASSPTSASASAAEATPTLGTPGKTVNTDNSTSNPKKDSDKPMVKDDIPYSTALVDASGPWAAFRDKYKRTWKPLKYYPPRGSLAVHGMVALDSPKGRVFIDVFAWYHPKTGQFHQDSLLMSLRSISPNGQKPRR